MAVEQYNVQEVLEFACAAQRENGEYVKETVSDFTTDGHEVHLKFPNKLQIMRAVGATQINGIDMPPVPKVTDVDLQMAADIRKHYKRWLFSAVEGDNEFQTEVNRLLNSELMGVNRIGYVACLPSLFKRDSAELRIARAVKHVECGFLDTPGYHILDKDCEILACSRSKAFDAFNITAIIDNKMVQWISKTELEHGPCVVINGRVKEHSSHYKHGNSVTRLNYVKAFQ